MMISALAAVSIGLAPPRFDALETYDEVCRVVEARFFDPDLNGVDWAAACAGRRGDAAGAANSAELAVVVNELLSALETSHTAMYPRGSRAWAELMDVFFDDTLWESFPESFAELPVRCVSAGLVTRTIGGRTFIADIYPGSAGDGVDLLVGDELISVNGRAWSDRVPWPAGAGEPVEALARRTAGGDPHAVLLGAEAVRPDDVFLGAQEQSARLIERDGATVAYVRLRSGAGMAYMGLLERQILWGELSAGDALVLDIRGGWGGVPFDTLNLFARGLPVIERRLRAEGWERSPVAWEKPLVLLIDGGSGSGKEVLAYGLKASGRATLVGETTAGAVMGGSPIALPDGSLLYLAVVDVRVDGARIEGVGVAPDVEVAFDLAYSAGADPQLERAIEEAVRLLESP